MEILITGATGLVGSVLVPMLQQRGHHIRYLTTSLSKTRAIKNASGYFWNIEKQLIDPQALTGVEVIVHLAGASIGKRWTSSYKKEILESRIASAGSILKSLPENHGVRHFVSASGIGFYPNSLSERYDENFSGKATGFVADVVREWEQAADAFSKLGIAVSKIRTGLVLSRSGGALDPIAKPVRWGLGSGLGSGKQVVSWIHIEDLAAIFTMIIENRLSGIFNAVAPNPVTQGHFMREVATALDKPFWLPNVPASLLRIGLGEMSALLLEGQFVSSQKIRDAGFNFHYPNLSPALKNLLA